MGTFDIIFIVSLFVVVLFLAGTDKFQFKELDEIKNRLEKLDGELTHMALEVAGQRQFINDLTDRVEELEKQLDRVPIEEMDEEIKRMASWNDGWSEIVNFGKDIPKLNKEVLKHE